MNENIKYRTLYECIQSCMDLIRLNSDRRLIIKKLRLYVCAELKMIASVLHQLFYAEACVVWLR